MGHLNINLDKGTKLKTNANLQKDGSLFINEGQQIAEFESLLKNIHQKTCEDLPQVNIKWEEGTHKSHLIVDGNDIKAKDFAEVSVRAVANILSKMQVSSKLVDFIPQLDNNPTSFGYEQIVQQITDRVGILDCAVNKAGDVIDHVIKDGL